MLLLRDLPKYETLLAYSKRYRNVEPSAVEAFLNLLRVASDVLDSTEQYFIEQGTSQGRFTVLCLLNRNPDVPLCPADLAQRAGVTRATMTGLLQGLEAEGLVKRTSSEEDKRMFFVELTGKGRRYLDNILPDWFKRVGSLMEGINDRERGTMLKLLEKVRSRKNAFSNGTHKVAEGHPGVRPVRSIARSIAVG
jgi:DNA-binding MarR family transcriptional regulator